MGAAGSLLVPRHHGLREVAARQADGREASRRDVRRARIQSRETLLSGLLWRLLSWIF